MSKPNHRLPTKQTPFVATSSDGTRSHHQRTAMTTSIRKARRGQTVSRKRHVQFASHMNNIGGGNRGGQMTTDDNPYSKDAQHIKEAIRLSRSIVRLCSSTQQQQQQLAIALDRLCVLLTPDDEDVNPSSQQMNISHDLNNNSHDYAAERNSAAGGISYDSSMAGMAANAILSQFITLDDCDHDEGGMMMMDATEKKYGDRSNNLAVLLANSLGYIISPTQQQQQQQNTNIDNNNSSLQIKAVIVLNQLAATDPPPPQQLLSSESSMLGALPPPPPASLLSSSTGKEIPTSWCHVIVNSTALSSLLQQLPTTTTTTTSATNTPPTNNIALCEKCVFVIGNLMGDSFMARQTLLELGALSILIACVRLGLERLKLLLLLGHQQQQQQQVDVDTTLTILQLLRNSIWSLINFIRGGDTSSSSSSLSFITEIQGVDLATLLSLPESVIQSINNVECSVIGASFDVAIETCWLIVFLLTNNNSFGIIENWLSNNNVILGLVTRLSSGVDAAKIRFHAQQVGGGTSSTTLVANDHRIAYSVSNSCIPCCRALMNIAIYLDSISPDGVEEAIRHQVKQSVTSTLLSGMTSKCLVELISLGSIGGGTEASTIACSAASLASICLAEASHDFERYATSAEVWSLLPALVQGLIGPLSTYDFRREGVWAIWNMLQFNPLQNRLLMEFIGTSPPEEVAKALTSMLTALESSDAVEPSLGLVDMLLRTLDDYHTRTTGKSLKILFEEVGLVDALWYVCDNDVDESDIAEKAAELIDDFYEEQEEDEEGADEMVTAPSVSGHQFQFQAPSNTGQFNFSNE